MLGIEFTLKDGTKEHYDPLEMDDFQETSDAYLLDMNYLYEIDKSKVESYRFYELCENCGYEMYEFGCSNCEVI